MKSIQLSASTHSSMCGMAEHAMAQSAMDNEIDVCTLGMFILDDIYPASSAPDQTVQRNVIGGAGTYSAMGARLFSPSPLSKSVGWVVDTGTDFPIELRELILRWNTGVLLRERDGLTTRGWNGYGDNEHRAFKYLTEKKRITADDLTPPLLASRSFHLICSASRCRDLIDRIIQRRKQELNEHYQRPLFIWEPVPDMCVASEMERFKEALPLVDVLSPNHEELASLFEYSHPPLLQKHTVEDQVRNLLDAGIGLNGEGAVVVRAGKEGCFAATRTTSRWLPAYHTNPERVIDPTGGGNGFLGGFAVGLARTGDVVEAALWGSVAASLCIEQVGLPALTSILSDKQDEEWNGSMVIRRLEEFRLRIIEEERER